MESRIYTERITSVAALRSSIKVMEVEQQTKQLELKDQFYLAYESLKPVNIVRSTLKDFLSASDNFSGTAVGAAGGYLVKKLLVGSSGSMLRKLIGTALQIGMTNIGSHKSDVIKSAGQAILRRLFRRKDRRSDTSDS